jgi:hypothetical protein
MKAGFPTGTRRCRLSDERHSSRAKSVCLPREINAFTKTLSYLLKQTFGFIFCKL